MTVGSMLAVVLRPSKIRYDATRPLSHTKRIRAALTAGLSVTIAVVLFFAVQFAAILWTSKTKVYAYEQTFIVTPSQPAITQQQPKQNVLNDTAIQEVVARWSKKYGDRASVTILNTATGETIAAAYQDKQYFTASIYKLYVAYFASQDIDAGLHSETDMFLGAYTRADCIARMIQYSDSPCAEKMLADIGKVQVNQRLTALGATGTSLIRFTTTSHDAALVTRLVAEGTGLKPDSAKRMQDAMAAQVYRDALPKGFKNSQVSDKVGFYDTGYHDSANVTPAGGPTVTVSVLSENMGSRQITELAQLLEPVLVKN
jgi:beta-lactamase class A